MAEVGIEAVEIAGAAAEVEFTEDVREEDGESVERMGARMRNPPSGNSGRVGRGVCLMVTTDGTSMVLS